MIKAYYKIFLFMLCVACCQISFAQQKITVYDDISSLPIYDVNVIIYGIDVVPEGDGWRKSQTLGGFTPVEQHFTNKKGKIQTDIFELADSAWRISFHHEEYISSTLTLDSLEKTNFKVYLQSSANTLEETVVSANRISEKKKDVIQKIKVIRSKEIEFQNQSSMADLISSTGNVFVQKSQLGGGSPIIRGFETNKVLMVVDGVRMNNAIYRGGHLQNVISLDNSIMERVELVFGPGSVMYGSDAIGGVMTFKTKDPSLSHNDSILIIGQSYFRYFSAASGFSSNANISVANKKLGSLTSFTYSNFGDLMQGAERKDFVGEFGARDWYVERINGLDSIRTNSTPNLQRGSGYAQYDILQKFVYEQNQHVSHTLNLQLSNSSTIDRYDRLTQMSDGVAKYAEWYYGPQFRFMSAYTMSINKKNRAFDASKLTLAYQSIEESRMVRRYREDELKNRNEALDIYTLNFDFTKQLNNHEMRYGIDAFYNFVDSKAFSQNISTMEIFELDTRYPDGGSNMSSMALYVTDNWELNDQIILSSGLRASHVRLNASFVDMTFFPFPFDEIHQVNNSINGNIGMIFMPNESIRYTLSGSTGFRAPNIDDVSKVFESVPGKVMVPNPDLKPEYSYTIELGLEHNLFEKVNLSTNLYSTFLNNALTVNNTTFQGSDSILYDDVYSQVITTTNANRAYVCGVEGILSGNIGKSFNIYSTFNYTYGRILTDSIPYPLDHIPPVFGKVSIKYHWKRFSSEFFLNYSGWKRIEDYNLVGEDNYSFALPEGMPSWYTLNLRCHYYFSKNISLQVACENILDHNYRKFASNISSPGRNFIITLRGKF